jgi:hypothetical protein
MYRGTFLQFMTFIGNKIILRNEDDFKNMKKLEKMLSKRAVLLSEEIGVKGKMTFVDFDKWAVLRNNK